MVRYACRIVGDMDDANDCVQDTLVKLLRSPTALEAVPSGYSLAVLRNTCFDLIASRKRTDQLLDRHAQTPADAEAWLEAIVTRAEWESLLQMLTPGTRRVLVLLAEGYKHRDIAAQLGISTKTVAAHRDKVRQIARRRPHAPPQERERERGSWYTYYYAFDPLFTWWVETPYKELGAALDAYVAALGRAWPE
jgi:RNA polymerase sigma factor (sigma-70 family)